MPKLQTRERAELLERFRRYLREHRLPVTRQRDRIAEAVFQADGHLSVSDLQLQLARVGEHVGLATVYRTLDVLQTSGLVRAHDFGEGFKRYEAVPGGDAQGHEHLICMRCGSVIEFTNDRLERMLPIIADEHAFVHQRHRVEIHGICQACRSRDLEAL